MSTPPPVPSRSGMPAWLKWLLGLSVGCFVLVIACCLGTCIAGKNFGEGMIGKFQKAEQERALSRAASERVAALDLEFPPRMPEDVALAEPTDEDVQRYLRVRRALEAPSKAYQDVIDRAVPQSSGTWGVLRVAVDMLGASLDAAVMRRQLLEAAEPALRAEGMGPTDLERLAEMVEWRLLRRDDAAFLGLPAAERREELHLQIEERMLSAWTASEGPPGMRIDGRSREDALRDLEKIRERRRELRALAESRTALSGIAVAALEPHAAELQALSSAGLQALAPLTSEPPFVVFHRDSNRSIEAGGEWRGGPSGDSDVPEGEPPAPDGEPPAPDGEPSAPDGEPSAPEAGRESEGGDATPPGPASEAPSDPRP